MPNESQTPTVKEWWEEYKNREWDGGKVTYSEDFVRALLAKHKKRIRSEIENKMREIRVGGARWDTLLAFETILNLESLKE